MADPKHRDDVKAPEETDLPQDLGDDGPGIIADLDPGDVDNENDTGSLTPA